MTREDYIKLFTNAIKQSEEGIVHSISNDICDIDDESVYFEFSYQIKDEKRFKTDDEVRLNIEKLIGDNYGVSISRDDSFTNGNAAYTITIDS